MFLVNAIVSYLTTNHEPAKASPWQSRVLVRLILLRDYYHIADSLYILDNIFVRIIVAKGDGVVRKPIGKPLRVYIGFVRWIYGNLVVRLLVGEDEKPKLVSFELHLLR
jgi:hypothetical protein